MFWDGRSNSIEEQVFHPIRNPKEMALNWKTVALRLNRSEFYKTKFKNAFGTVYIDSTHVSKALAQFERKLISNNSKYDKVLRNEIDLTSDEYAGLNLVNNQTKGNCLHCHTSDSDARGTTGRFSNNGLNMDSAGTFTDNGLGKTTGKTKDNGKFKIPSFRNLNFTAPYMHDGRFKTLEEVLDFYSEGIQNNVNIDNKMAEVHKGGIKLTDTEKKQIIAFLRTMSDSSFISNPSFSNPFPPNKKAD